MAQEGRAAEIEEIAGHFEDVISKRRQDQAKIIQETAAGLEPKIEELRKTIGDEMTPLRRTGAPCSMLRIIGQNHLEKPMNRILKWCSDENGTHGFGREFLKHLAYLAELPEMHADLKNGSLIEVWGEEAIDSSGNMPDLFVRTDNAALLFENKLNAGESGDQYQPYRIWFEQFESTRKRRLVLSAPGERGAPPGWTYISHAKIAAMFYQLAQFPLSIWGRIIAIQCAVAFDEAMMEAISGAKLIPAINEAANGKSTLHNWRKLLHRQPLHLPVTPWENKI